MSGVRDVVADHVRSVLLVVGVGLLLLGGVGPGSVGAVSVLGVVTLLAAVLLATPIERLLRTDDEAAPANDPVADLQERYVAGEIDREEFERRVERQLAADESDRELPVGTAASREREPE